MNIGNFNDQNKMKDAIALFFIVLFVLFCVWMLFSPGDKLAQFSFIGNKIKLCWAKNVQKVDVDEWKFHRNNAICLAKMKNKDAALREMDLALKTITVSESDYEYYRLCKDSAMVRLYFKDYAGALDDYLKLPNLSLVDKLKVAMLFKKVDNNKEAAKYCNEILNTDTTAYAGYACLADIYANVGKYDVSVRIYDLLISRTSKNPLYFVDRANYKKLAGDFQGYEDDLATAKGINSVVKLESNLLENVINPKALDIDMI